MTEIIDEIENRKESHFEFGLGRFVVTFNGMRSEIKLGASNHRTEFWHIQRTVIAVTW